MNTCKYIQVVKADKNVEAVPEQIQEQIVTMVSITSFQPSSSC